jgi:hypothetical protein
VDKPSTVCEVGAGGSVPSAGEVDQVLLLRVEFAKLTGDLLVQQARSGFYSLITKSMCAPTSVMNSGRDRMLA